MGLRFPALNSCLIHNKLSTKRTGFWEKSFHGLAEKDISLEAKWKRKSGFCVSFANWEALSNSLSFCSLTYKLGIITTHSSHGDGVRKYIYAECFEDYKAPRKHKLLYLGCSFPLGGILEKDKSNLFLVDPVSRQGPQLFICKIRGNVKFNYQLKTTMVSL